MNFLLPFALIIPLVPILGAWFYFRMPSVSSAQESLSAAAAKAHSAIHYFNDAESTYNTAFSAVRHSRPFVAYQGLSTVVPISVFGESAVPTQRTVWLQKRGYRTGLLGWTLGGYMGGGRVLLTDVTPVKIESWSSSSSLTPKQREQYDKDIEGHLKSALCPQTHKLRETLLVHLPVASGDGYFRLLINPAASSKSPLIESAVFRVGSVAWSSASPRGASVVGIVPETVLQTGFLAGKTAAWTAFYSVFPVLKIAELMPGGWGKWAMHKAYKLAGGEEKKAALEQKYKVKETYDKAQKEILRPFRSEPPECAQSEI